MSVQIPTDYVTAPSLDDSLNNFTGEEGEMEINQGKIEATEKSIGSVNKIEKKGSQM